MDVHSVYAEQGAAPAELRVLGGLVLYRLYDVGYEIHLDRALDILATTPDERRSLRISLNDVAARAAMEQTRAHRISAGSGALRADAQAIQIKSPPVSVAMGRHRLSLAGRNYDVDLSARIFDFGVISLRLRCDSGGYVSWRDWALIGGALEASLAATALIDRELAALVDRLRPMIDRFQIAPVTEDYLVYRATELTGPGGIPIRPDALRDIDVVPLLLGEEREVSDRARRELLPSWFSYFADDLTILNWNNALVIDPVQTDTEVEFILEFANAQLLELRYYDALLDAELPKMYDRVTAAQAGGRTFLPRRYADVLTSLQALVADSTEMVERAENALKVTDDVYLARVYSAALDIFRARAWRTGIDRKLGIIRDTYTMLNVASQAARAETLEFAIIALIALEIGIAIFK